MKRSLVAALVAVVLAVIGCVSVLFYVSGAETRALTGKDPVKVVIAAKKIPAGTTGARIRSGGYIEIVAMPRSSVPADAMSELDPSLDELVVTSEIQPRQLLLRGAFGAPSKSNAISLPEGKLAVSFAVHCVGNVRAGDQVAIFNTYPSVDGVNPLAVVTDEKGEMKWVIPAGAQLTQIQWVTRLLLPKLEVMSVAAGKGEEKKQDKPDPKASGGAAAATAGNAVALTAPCDGSQEFGNADAGDAMVTVAVTQPEAERLILARHIGVLTVGIADEKSDVKPGPGTSDRRLYG